MANTIEIVIKASNQAGSTVADVGKQLGDLNSSAANAVGGLGKFGSTLGNIFATAAGFVAAHVFENIVGGLTSFVSTGLNAVGTSQQLETSLKALLTANLMYSQTTETVTSAVTKQLMTQSEYGQKLDELNAKLQTQKATYQEQQERIRQLTVQYGDNGLAVIKAKAQHDQLMVSIRGTEQDIAGLTTTETKYTTNTQLVYKQTMSQAEAFKLASTQTRELTDFISKLAVVSPFETQDVELVTKYAVAAGMGVDTTKNFIPAFLDLAGAVGITSNELGFAADQLFQVKKTGKLTEIDLRQLRRVGIDLGKIIGVEMGMSIEEFNAKAAKSPAIFDELFSSIAKFSSNTFAGTAQELAMSIKGLQSTFSDIFVIGARTFLRPLVDAMTPTVAAIAETLRDFVLGGNMAQLGQQAAAALMSGFQNIKTLGAVFQNSFTGGVRLLLYKLGFNNESTQIIVSWINKAKSLITIFQTGGLFGSEVGTSGQKAGGLLQALGISSETVTILKGVFSQISTAISTFVGTLNTQLGGLTQSGVLNSLAAGFATIVSVIVNSLNVIVPTVATAITTIVGLFNQYGPTIAAVLQTVFVVATAVFNGIATGINATLQPALVQIGTAFSDLGINWSAVGSALLTATGYVFAGIGAVLLMAVSVVVGLVGAVISGVGTMVQYWGLLMQSVSAVIAGVMMVVTGLSNFWTAVFAGDIPTALQAMQMGFTGVFTIVIGIITGIGTAIAGMVAVVVSLISGLVTSIVGFWQGLFMSLVGGSIVWDIVNGINAAFTLMSTTVQLIISGFVLTVTNIFNTLTAPMISMANLFKITLLNSIMAVSNFIQSTLSAAFSGISEKISGDLTPILQTLSGEIIPSLTTGLDLVSEAIKQATGYFNSLVSAVKNFSLPEVLQPGSPPPFAIALTNIADAAKVAKGAISSLTQGVSTSSSTFATMMSKTVGLQAALAKNLMSRGNRQDINHLFENIMPGFASQFESGQFGTSSLLDGIQQGLSALGGNTTMYQIADALKKAGINFSQVTQQMNEAFTEAQKVLRLQNAAQSASTASQFVQFGQTAADRLSNNIDTLKAIIESGKSISRRLSKLDELAGGAG